MANSSLPGGILELDGLRGTAIAMVVLRQHFYYYRGETHRPSGFIRSADVHFEQFYRIIPLYHGWIVCYLLVMVLKGHFFSVHFSSLAGPATDSYRSRECSRTPEVLSMPGSSRRWIALLGRRHGPTDGVADYCTHLGAALGLHGYELEIAPVPWP
jgi:hypothetical protein